MSGEHDAASVVGGMAGLSGGGERPAKVDPEKLIERFCGDEARGLRADPGVRTEPNGTKVASGWCGFNGTRSDDPIVSGFDDGYDFMGALSERGWQPLSGKGDWPYVVYLQWRGRPGEYVIAEYCEADLTVWVFPNSAAAKAQYDQFRDCP